MARLPLVVVLFLAGCLPLGPTAPVATLPPQPEALASRPGGVGDADSIRYVVHVSVDGLRPDAVMRQPPTVLTAFARLRTESAFTQNARTDPDFRITLPNHSAQLTGRGVVGPDGHNWTVNVDPAPGVTLHSNKGAYVASVFDVAHDAGLRTAAYVSKSKFSLFDVSYDAEHGAPDETGEDDGTDKIDTFVYDPDTSTLTDRIVADLQADPAAYTFVHLRDPDATGHWRRWSVRSGSPYMRAVQAADDRIGRILDAVEADPRLRGHTALIVTADHGGSGRNHSSEKVEHYTVPFYVWGPGVPSADLYALNPDTRADPDAANVGFDAERQPVRNGDAADLALALLGLDPVPGSTIGAEHPLRVRADQAAPAPEAGAGPGTPAPAASVPAPGRPAGGR